MKKLLLVALCLLVVIVSPIFGQDLLERTASNQKRQVQNQTNNRLAKLIETTHVAHAKTLIEANVFKVDNQSAFKTNSMVTKAVHLQLDTESLKSLFKKKPQNLSLRVPVNEKSNFTLKLTRANIKTSDYQLRTSSGTINLTYNDQLFYRGIVEQDNQSIAAVSINENSIRILASDSEGNYVVGKQQQSDQYVLYNDQNLKVANEFNCGTPDEITAGSINIDNSHDGTGSAVNSKCVPVYIEADYTFFTIKNNSVSEVENYLTALFNEVSTIYFNDEINTSISEIFVHNVPGPFVNYTNTADALRGFREIRQSNFNGRLAHLVSGRRLGGGRAYIDVLCSSNSNHAVSQLYGFYNQFPTYSWDLYVFSHEMGHNLGSFHTHACVWNGNRTAIDGCSGSTEGNCALPAVPSNGGTLMSYCHQRSVGINFSRGFGTEPGQLVRGRFGNATCDLACGSVIEINMPMAGDSWQTGSSNNIIWFDNIDENVKIELYRGNSRVSSISNSIASNGTFNWTVPSSITEGSNYRIKITSVNNTSLFDFSDDFSITAPRYISITYPDLNELWEPGSSYTIQWKDNISENVSISLYQNNSYITSIANSTASNGNYTWTVPLVLSPGSNFKIRINSTTSNLFGESAFFEIQTSFQPTIEVINPNGNTIWQTGSSYLIQWEKNLPDNVRIELYKGNTQIQTIETNYNGNSLGITVPDLYQPGTDYRIKISSATDNAIFDWSDYFQIEKTITDGEIVVTVPVANAVYEIGESLSLIWESNIDAPFKIELYKGNTLIQTLSSSHSGSNAFAYFANNNLAPGTDYRFKVTAVTQQAEFDFSDYFEFKSSDNQGAISISSPNNSSIWSPGNLATVVWTSTINGSFAIELYKNNVFVGTISQNFTSPLNFISINNPKAGEKFQQGDNFFASWETNSTSNFKLELYRGSIVEIILQNVYDGVWYDWTIWNSIPDGDNYRLKVSISDDGSVYDFSDYFSIGSPNNPESITVTKPAVANTIFYIGGLLEMEWESTVPPPYTIEFYDGDTYSETYSTTYQSKSLSGNIRADAKISDQHRFKISSTTDPSVFGWSKYFSVQNPANSVITVTVNYDILFTGGYTYPIEYVTNATNNFNFDLYKGNNFVETLYSNTTGFLQGGNNNYSINYKTPENSTIITGTDYRIKMTSVVDENLYDFSDYFEYKNVNDYNFNITHPKNNTIWQTGQTYTIQWMDDVDELMTIMLYFNNTYVMMIGRSVPGTSYQWTVPEGLSADSNYRIKMVGDNNQTIKDYSDFFTIQNNNAAFIELSSPNLNDEWQAGSKQLINWTDNLSNGLDLQLLKGNATISTLKNNLIRNGYVWDLPEDLITGGDYRVKAISSIDNSVYHYSDYFTVINFCDNAAQSSNEWIEVVSFNHLYHASGNNNGYADFTHLGTDVVAGESYTINLTPGYMGSAYPENWSVWIDLNDDGNFTNTELLFQTNQAIVGNVKGNITIPGNTNLNTVRMRVAMSWNSQSTDACGTSNMFGEFEDYSLYINDSNCFNTINLENQNATAGSYQAVQYIQSATPVYAPQTIEYKAGKYIELKSGFEVGKTINFNARIGACE